MAAGDILIVEGTKTIFGTDVAWTSLYAGVIAGAGAQSAVHDLGAYTTGRANLYRVRFYTQFSNVAVVGESVDVYLNTSDDISNHYDSDIAGDVGYGAGDKGKLNNLYYIGSAIVNATPANTEFVLSANEVLSNARWINAVAWNSTAASISTTAIDSKLELTEIIYQGQS